MVKGGIFILCYLITKRGLCPGFGGSLLNESGWSARYPVGIATLSSEFLKFRVKGS